MPIDYTTYSDEGYKILHKKLHMMDSNEVHLATYHPSLPSWIQDLATCVLEGGCLTDEGEQEPTFPALCPKCTERNDGSVCGPCFSVNYEPTKPNFVKQEGA